MVLPPGRNCSGCVPEPPPNPTIHTRRAALIRSAAVPVPAGLGVQDAAYVLCLRALAVADVTTLGAAFVVIKRGKDLFWIVVGFLLLGFDRRSHSLAAIAEGGAART